MIKFWDGIKTATNSLKADKLRSILTTISLIIGNTSVILLVGIGTGAKQLATEELASFGHNMLYVIPDKGNVRETKGNPKTLILADADAVRLCLALRDRETGTFSVGGSSPNQS